MTSHTTEANRNPNNALLEEDRPTIQFSGIIYAPARLAFSIFSSTFAALRPFAPQLIPIIFCFLFIPFSLILSGAAGIIVWRNVAVGWESPIYLQFGCVAFVLSLTTVTEACVLVMEFHHML